MSTSRTVKFEFLKVRVSRAIRGTFRKAATKMGGGNTGKAETIFGEEVESTAEQDRGNKLRSSSVIFVAGSAIGISHVVAMSSKYGIKPSRKFTIGAGAINGAITAGLWYKSVNAAKNDLSEDDIHMVFDMMTSTGMGRDIMSADKDNKVTDIFHTIVTGKSDLQFDDDGQIVRQKSEFTYEDEETTDKTEKGTTVSKDNVFAKGKQTFQEETGTASNGFSNKRGSISVGKPLGTGSTSRKSFLPDLDREEAESKEQTKEDWLDFS